LIDTTKFRPMTYKDLIDQQAKDYAKSITKNDTYSEYLVDAYKAGQTIIIG